MNSNVPARPRPLARPLAPLTLLALLAGSSLSPAMAQARSDVAVQKEIAFARGLASDWGFVDMAQRVVEEAAAGEVSERMSEELALVKCDLYFGAARRNSDRRNELLASALDSYKQFVERRPYSELLPQAEAQLVSVAGYYARSLAITLDQATGEEAAALRTTLQSVLDDAIAQSNKLISGLEAIPAEDRSEADSRRLFDLLLNLGDMYLELAKTQDEPTFSFEQSYKAYEDLVDAAGDGEPAALRAFVGIGNNLFQRGDYEDAAAFYEYVVEWAMPRHDVEAWAQAREEMSPAELEKRFLFVQLATAGLVDSLARAGDMAEAAAWGMHFLNSWKLEGLNLHQPLGYIALLGVANSLLSSGGFVGGPWASGEGEWFATREELTAAHPGTRNQKTALEIALSLAQTANNENRGNTLQIRAQKLIKDIISRPGVDVDPEILYEAAMGSYNAKDYPAAVDSFRRVLAALEHADTVKRTEIGPRVLWHMGRSYQQLDRLLEASATFQTALERFSGDPEYDPLNAKDFYNTMRALKRDLSGDTAIEALFTKAETLHANYSSSAEADINYSKADKAYQEGNFEAARDLYLGVTLEAQSYEKAIVFAGVCHYKLGDYDAAVKVFDDYINKYLTDPANQLSPGPKVGRRQEAEATAWFYWGLTAFVQAENGDGEWQVVIDKLLDYETRFEGQVSYAPAAMYRVMVAYDRLDQRPEARAIYESMLQTFPENRWTGRASGTSYNSLKARHDAEEDPAAKAAILREMAENLQVLNRTAASPSYPNMKTEAGHWMELLEYETAEAIYESALAKFGADNEEDIQKFVLPKLGEAYVWLNKPQKAAETLAGLVDDKKATRGSAQLYGRALAGWVHYVEESEPPLQIRVGLGGEENISRAIEVVFKPLDGGAEKWTAEWFDYKFDMLYAYYQWSQLDSKKLEVVKGQLEYLSNPANLGPTYKNDQMPEDLRQKYLWLDAEVN